MPTNVTWNGTSRSIPSAGELNWAALSGFLVDLGQNAATTNFQKISARTATSSPVTVAAATDCVVVTDLAAPGAVTVNLPAGADGQYFVIVDGKGDAATNNVTINRNGADTINGGTSHVIKVNRGGVVLVYEAGTTNWSVAMEFLGNFTASRAMASDAQGRLTPSATTATELGYVSGVTSAIQTQLGGKASTALDNLSSTALNADIVPAANNARDHGSDAAEFKDVWAHGVKHNDATNPNLAVQTTGNNGAVNITAHGSGDINLQSTTGKVAANRPLEVSGTSSYVKVPSLTTTERNALTPADGQIIFNSTNSRYEAYKNAAWAELGSAASGGINFVSNPDAEGGVVSGVSSTNVTVTAETGSNKIFGNQSFKGVSSVASAFVHVSMNSIPTFWNNNLFQAGGNVNFTSIASGVTWRVGIYNTTDSAWLAYQDVTVAAKYDINLLGIVDTSKTYVWRIQSTAGTPSSDTFYFDNLSWGPLQKAAGGVPIHEYRTPTTNSVLSYGSTNSTNATVTTKYARTGNLMTLSLGVAFTGAANANGSITFSLPDNLTLDTTQTSEPYQAQGVAWGYFNSKLWTGTVRRELSSGKFIIVTEDGSGGTPSTRYVWAGNTTAGSNVPAAVAITAADTMSVIINDIPISQWAGETVSLANSRVEFLSNSDATSAASNTTDFIYGPLGNLIPNQTANTTTIRRVRSQIPLQPNESLVVQVDRGSSGAEWFQAAQLFPHFLQSGKTYGIAIIPISTTDTDIYFYESTTSSGATYASNGSTWSAVNTWRWRVVKSSNPLGIGTGLATSTTPGAYAAGLAPGATNGQAIAAGYVGQVLTETRLLSSATALTTTIAKNVTSSTNTGGSAGQIILTPGVWLLYGMVGFDNIGTTVSGAQGAISLTSNTIPASSTYGVQNSSGEIIGSVSFGAANAGQQFMAQFSSSVSISVNTTFYLIAVASFSGGTSVSAYGSIRAYRIA